MNSALPRILITMLALAACALMLVVGAWYASRRAGGVGAAALWAGATVAFASYMIWRNYHAVTLAGLHPSLGFLSGSVYVALATGMLVFAPTTWYVSRQQRGGHRSLSRTLVLRGIGVFALGCLVLLGAALLLDIARLSTQ